jgi:cytochrome c553
MLTASLSLPLQAAGDQAAGKEKSAVCAGCHGVDGNSTNPEWPKLAGQGAAYLVKQLQNFKSKERDNATMYPQAANLSDQDIADIAAYYSAQTPKLEMADEKVVTLGETLFRGGNPATGVAACSGCHAPNGVGNPAAKFPRLAGQHAKYTAVQLKYFRNAERANDAGKMMRNITLRMTDTEIEAVSQYIAGLR